MTHQAGKMHWYDSNMNKRKIPASKPLNLCIKSLNGHNNKASCGNNLGDIYTVHHGDLM